MWIACRSVEALSYDTRVPNIMKRVMRCHDYGSKHALPGGVLLLLILVTGCSYVPMLPGLSPYKIDIQQGNYVTQDMISKLKPGMSKSQVRFALGTPLVVDPFHADRWDYVYVLQKRGRVIEQRRIVVLFQDDKLTRIDGDVVSSDAPASVAEKPLQTP